MGRAETDTGFGRGSLTGYSVSPDPRAYKVWDVLNGLGSFAFAYSFSNILVEISVSALLVSPLALLLCAMTDLYDDVDRHREQVQCLLMIVAQQLCMLWLTWLLHMKKRSMQAVDTYNGSASTLLHSSTFAEPVCQCQASHSLMRKRLPAGSNKHCILILRP